MDYLSELLESYSKLKKRTYKITYISESYTPEQLNAFPEIDSAIQAAAAGNPQTGLGKNKNIDISPAQDKPGYITISGSNLGRKNLNATNYKNEINPSKTHSASFSRKLLGAWAPDTGEGSQDGMSPKDIEKKRLEDEKAAEQERNKTVEGSLDDPEYADLIPKANATLNRLMSLARDGLFGDISEAQIASTYFVKGNSSVSTGILGKIMSAEVRTVDDDGLSTEAKMSPAMAAKILDNFEAITTFVALPEEEKADACEDVKRQVGFYKNQLILFGNDPSELLVVGSNKSPNKLYQIGLNAIEESCGFSKKDFTKVAGSAFSTQEKNAVKGVLFEEFHVVAAMMVNGNVEEGKAALISALKSKAAILKDIQAARGDSGLTLDEAYAQVVQDELLEALGDNEALKKYLLNEMSLALPFAKFMGADSVQPVGLEVATGAREDLDYIYSDQDKAAEKAEAIGSEVRVIGPNQYAVGVGLKRLSEIQRAKFGEINSVRRMLEIIAGGGKGKNLDPEFQTFLYKNLYDYSTEREIETARYAEDLEGKVGKAAVPFMENTTYSKGGKIKAVTPEQLAKSAFSSMKKRLGFKDLKNSALRDTLFEKKGKEFLLKEFSGDGPSAEDNRQRLAEKVGRLERMNLLKKDLASGNQAAEDYVMAMAFTCGANTRDLSQLISDDSGKVLAVKHNKILTDIAQAKDRKFEVKGTKIVISGGGSTVILDQSHTKTSSGKSNTRTSLYVPKETLEKYASDKNFSPTQNTREEVSRLFIQGQIKLLEELLNQTNGNPLL
jgi:hypothetical protein